MELYAHNQMAYEALVPMLEQYRRAAVVHPTGTGKSFLAFQLIEDHPEARFLWLSPNDYIFENQRRNAGSQFPNVEFMTYTKLLRVSEEALGEAIVRGILPAPRYVTTVFQYQNELCRYQKRIDTLVPQGMKGPSQRYLDALRRALSRAEGLEKVFARYLKKGEKYILFCSDWAHLQEIKENIPTWFREVDGEPRCYCLYAGKPETEAEYAEFLADQSDQRKSGKLPAERVAKLDEIGMIWNVFDARWEMHYRQAKESFETHGNLDIPTTYSTKDGFLLETWIVTQRKARTGEGKAREKRSNCLRRRLTGLRPSAWSGTAPLMPSGRVPTPVRRNTTGRTGI